MFTKTLLVVHSHSVHYLSFLKFTHENVDCVINSTTSYTQILHILTRYNMFIFENKSMPFDQLENCLFNVL